MSKRLLAIEIEARGRFCDGCAWADPAAAGACVLWGRAMTSGRRIPECLAAERAAEQLRGARGEPDFVCTRKGGGG